MVLVAESTEKGAGKVPDNVRSGTFMFGVVESYTRTKSQHTEVSNVEKRRLTYMPGGAVMFHAHDFETPYDKPLMTVPLLVMITGMDDVHCADVGSTATQVITTNRNSSRAR